MMRRFVMCCCAVVLIGCAKKEQPPAQDTTAAAPAAPAAPAAISLTDVAGKWTVVVTNEAGDSTLLTYELTATAEPTGWTITFPNRKPVAVRIIAVNGDSIVTESGPYESVLRKGVQVSTHAVSRLQDGKMVGTTVAHYKTSGPDSVRRIRFQGTRAP
jgi:hypothetical protein